MSNGIKPKSSEPVLDTIRRCEGDDAKVMVALYDEYAAIVLGFLEKITDERQKAEELLQAVFLSLPGKLSEFDPEKARFTVWILRLARTTALSAMNAGNEATNGQIHEAPQNVGEISKSVVELLYVKGFTFAQAAAELGIEENAVRTLVRNELKTFRSGPNA